MAFPFAFVAGEIKLITSPSRMGEDCPQAAEEMRRRNTICRMMLLHHDRLGGGRGITEVYLYSSYCFGSKRRWKFSVVMRLISSNVSARSSASFLAVCTMSAGSLRLPRFGTGAR